ncbi:MULTISPECIES: PLP-dependent aminotransferase family protein [Bacteria]|uniref:MocR-like transcription factor YczR n=1 Tax=Bacteria TaxID=2 RepID=UPI003C7D8BDB
MTERAITAESLRRQLGSWRTAGVAGPVYRALADGIALLVVDGRLPLEARIPSERALSAALRVSRTTVTAAYAALREDGYLRGHQSARSTVALPGAEVSALTADRTPTAIDLQSAATVAPGATVLRAYQAAVAALPIHVRGSGHERLGIPVLRSRIAARFTRRGLPTTEGQILVTSGAQQAISLLLNVLIEPGDRVLVEQPTYHGALEAIAVRGARPVPVPLHTHVPDPGWDLAGIEAAIRQTAPNLAYLVPDNHNPTGLTMSLARRQELAGIVTRTRTRLIVDETLVDTWWREPGPAPLASLVSRSDLAITVGSMAKSFWGGMRVGWIRADETVVAGLLAARSSMDTGTPIVEQLAAAELLSWADEIEAEQREALRSRRSTLVRELGRSLPDWELLDADGGLCVWARLPTPSSTALAAAAARLGCRIAPGPRFGVGGPLERFVRIPFSLPEEELRAGVALLARAWAAVTGAGAGVDPPAEIVMVG